MISRIRKHARSRLAFEGTVSNAKRLAACKRFLRLESTMILMRHKAGDSGLKVAHGRSALIDVLLQNLFDYAIAAYERTHGNLPCPVALVALGGYGRAELSPFSDVDIMFLYPEGIKLQKIKPLQTALTDDVLYLLWDLGLKIGHSSRTVDEVFQEARKDIQTKTSLLESRFVAGSQSLFTTFEQAYRNFYLKEDPKGYIASRLEDQATRRTRYGNTVFLQEPDIKNGVGALRDYQNALWMARVKLGSSTIDDLQSLNYLRKNELKEFKSAYDYLLRVRNALHFQSKRPTDILNLDKQPRIAHQLGYTQRDILRRVEAFMRDYYQSAQNIFYISKLLEHRLSLAGPGQDTDKISFREVIRARRLDRTKRLDGFILRGRDLAFDTKNVFEKDPRRLIRVFRHAQQLNATLDFDLRNLIRESLPLLTKRVVRSAEANRSFKTILQTAGQVYPTLTVMHELGVLGKFMPEWGRLTCLVQHEFYHRYTADIHTLNTIRELDAVFTESGPMFANYREELRNTKLPNLLYLILLLHDIGKADGIENHAEAGARLAAPILDRLEIDPANRELIIFIIKNHLLMARFWQKYDLDDPATIDAFSEQVKDLDALRFLYVHTFCDARGTASSLWNSYKDTLHTTLFRRACDHLTEGKAVEEKYAEQFEMTRQELLSKKIPGVSKEEVTAHFNLLPERYFIHTDNDEIALHLQMVNRLLKTINDANSVGTLEPVIDWKDDLDRSLTIVNVVTWDRAGLFYKLAGALTLAGLSILSAKAIARNDHIAIDTFYVVEPGRGIVQSQKIMEAFHSHVNRVLVSNKDIYPEIVAEARKHQSTLLSNQDEHPLHGTFPATVEVYNELSLRRTIVELQTDDQIGLLYKLSKVIYDHGFDITFARINTERSIAIDTFYIENANHETAEESDKERLRALQSALTDVVAHGESKAVRF